MDEYLRKPQTIELIMNAVRTDLLSLSDECSLDLANAAIKVVFDDALDALCEQSKTWTLCKENYVEAVKTLYKIVLTKAKPYIFGNDSFVFQERTFAITEESIY